MERLPEGAWFLRGDRGLTYAREVPEGSRIVAGEWWPADYAGPPLISLDMIAPLAEVTHLLQITGLVPGLAPNPLEIGAEGRKVLERAAHPPSVFATEWAALEAEALRPTPAERTLEVATYLSLARRVVSPDAAARVRLVSV